jgi:hypothetical protein
MIATGDYIVRGAERGWTLSQDEEVVARYEVHYRARVIRCDIPDDGTWWFHMSRGTRLAARRDGSLDETASYQPRFRGGVITIGHAAYRLRPPGLRGESWHLTTDVRRRRLRALLIEMTLGRPDGLVRVMPGAAAGADPSLLATLALAAAILERSEPRLRTERWSP